MKNKLNALRKKWLYILFIIAPYIIGVIGYYLDPSVEGSNTLFLPLALYTLNLTDPPSNIWIEIARWWAGFATLSFLVSVLADWSENIDNWLQTKLLHRGKTIAIYCTDEEWENFDNQLIHSKEHYAIRGKGADITCADKFLLLGEEKDNLEFLALNREELENKKVYMKCSPMFSRTVNRREYITFCDEETAAREYWVRHALYRDARRSGSYSMDISIVGHSVLMEELLLWGLQVNLFSKEQKLTYHLFGDWSFFLGVHHELEHIAWDTVVFEGDKWNDHQGIIKMSDRVLVWSDQDMYAIKYAIPGIGARIHYMCDDLVDVDDDEYYDGRKWKPYPNPEAEVIFGEPVVYFWKLYAQDINRILNQTNINRGIRLNDTYNRFNDCDYNWNDLDSFSKYSNVSSAGYSDIWKYIAGYLMDETGDKWIDVITECEHERWCRYHYVNNWTLEPDDTALIKDSIKLKKDRRHNCLVPFTRLHQFMKDNDKRNVQYLAMMLREDVIGVMEDSTSLPVQEKYIKNNLRYYKRMDKTSDVVFEACIIPAFVHFDKGNEAGIQHGAGDVFIRPAGTKEKFQVLNGIRFEETFVEVYRE